MKQIMSMAITLTMALALSEASFALPKLDLKMPDIPEDVRQSMNENLHHNSNVRDKRINIQLLEEEYTNAQSFLDAELLSDLDLDEIGVFEIPANNPLFEDN